MAAQLSNVKENRRQARSEGADEVRSASLRDGIFPSEPVVIDISGDEVSGESCGDRCEVRDQALLRPRFTTEEMMDTFRRQRRRIQTTPEPVRIIEDILADDGPTSLLAAVVSAAEPCAEAASTET